MELNNELYRYLKLYNITRSKEANEATTIWWIEGIGALSPYLSRSTYNDKRDPRELVACYVDQELVYYNESYTLDVPSLRQTVYADKSLYDLSGRRVGQDDKGLRACSPEHLRSARTHSQTSSLPKGIYIQNGRKFVVKWGAACLRMVQRRSFDAPIGAIMEIENGSIEPFSEWKVLVIMEKVISLHI